MESQHLLNKKTLQSSVNNTNVTESQPKKSSSDIVVVPPKGLGLSAFNNILLRSDGILYNFTYGRDVNISCEPIDLDLSSGKIEWPLSDGTYDIVMS